jgi:hypothetical protein
LKFLPSTSTRIRSAVLPSIIRVKNPRQGGRIEFAHYVQLVQRPVPLPHHGQQLEQEVAQCDIGRILADGIL